MNVRPVTPSGSCRETKMREGEEGTFKSRDVILGWCRSFFRGVMAEDDEVTSSSLVTLRLVDALFFSVLASYLVHPDATGACVHACSMGDTFGVLLIHYGHSGTACTESAQLISHHGHSATYRLVRSTRSRETLKRGRRRSRDVPAISFANGGSETDAGCESAAVVSHTYVWTPWYRESAWSASMPHHRRINSTCGAAACVVWTPSVTRPLVSFVHVS